MFDKWFNNYAAKQSHEQARTSIGIIAGKVGLISNILLFVVKLFAGVLSGSISITTDAINNLADSASSLLTLFGFRAASKPPDKEHPYGHERSEYISGLLVSVIIIFVGIQFLMSSVNRILNPTSLNTTPLIFALLAVSIVVKMIQRRFYRTAAKKIRSNTLVSASQDSLNDVYITLIVLIASAVELFTGWKIDGYAGALLAIFIVYSGIQTIRRSIDDLLGSRPLKDEIKQMKDLLNEYDAIVGYHDLLVHSYGPNQTFATIHIEIDDRWDIVKAHRLIDQIETAFDDVLGVDLVCHVDPIAVQNEEHTAIYHQVKQILASFQLDLKFHDFKIEDRGNNTLILFDVVVPYDTEQTDEQLLKAIEENIHQHIGKDYQLKVTFDRLYLLKEI